MKIVVCIKTNTGTAVDDADASRRAGGLSPSALGPDDAHAVEEALRIAAHYESGEVVVVAVAPPRRSARCAKHWRWARTGPGRRLR